MDGIFVKVMVVGIRKIARVMQIVRVSAPITSGTYSPRNPTLFCRVLSHTLPSNLIHPLLKKALA